jgi:hypothetical protein
MAFQLPSTDVIENILANQQPVSPLDLTEVTDAGGNLLDQNQAYDQINAILGESGPLPGMVFPLMEELVDRVKCLDNARINTITYDGIVAGQMIEVRLYGVNSLDKYEAMLNLKNALEPWMPILSHPMFKLGKASLSDRLDKELKGREGRSKGSTYLQLSWSFDFVPHADLYQYASKDKAPAQTTQTSAQAQNETQASSGREF